MKLNDRVIVKTEMTYDGKTFFAGMTGKIIHYDKNDVWCCVDWRSWDRGHNGPFSDGRKSCWNIPKITVEKCCSIKNSDSPQLELF